jgi:hypothetical protein
MAQDRDLHILRDTGSEPATEDIQEATGKQIDEAAQHRPTLLDTTRDRLMTPFRVPEILGVGVHQRDPADAAAGSKHLTGPASP